MSIKHLTLIPIKAARTHLLLLSVTTVLYLYWLRRDDNYLTAENGTGYFLGIIGGSLMLALLLYPLSKRIKLLSRWIPVRYWFGIHMAFGILGPAMVVLHANFQLGSINSSIALFSMLLVAGSGLIGRYIYTHIHHGLYGARITLRELKTETKSNHMGLLELYGRDGPGSQRSEPLKRLLNEMEQKALQPYSGLVTNLAHVIELAINAQKTKRQVMKLLNEGFEADTEQPLPDSKQALDSVNRYTLALRRAAAFKLYERLFSLWHILHLPLFIMMIITAVIHIFAVHLY